MKRSREELEDLSYRLKESLDLVSPEIALFKEAIKVAINDIDNYLLTGVSSQTFNQTINFVTEVFSYLCRQSAQSSNKQERTSKDQFQFLKPDKFPVICILDEVDKCPLERV